MGPAWLPRIFLWVAGDKTRRDTVWALSGDTNTGPAPALPTPRESTGGTLSLASRRPSTPSVSGSQRRHVPTLKTPWVSGGLLASHVPRGALKSEGIWSSARRH